MSMEIHVGKSRRPVAVEIWICRRDTRWDVYPQREPRYLECLVLGDVYRRSPEGIWHRSCFSGIRLGLASEALLRRLGTTPKQLENIIAS